MNFCFSIRVALLLSVWVTAKCYQIPEGVFQMECRDRYFMIAVDVSFAGVEPHFEAVEDTEVHPITESYGAQHGYTVSVLPLHSLVELRASYFSCHTYNQEDKLFTFTFNVIVSHEGKEVTYSLNKTCSPALAWAPREVICEANYMEVSVRSDATCPTGTKKDDWNAAVQTAYTSAVSDWQVMFKKVGQELKPMSVSEASKQGYVFHLTDGRLVFRTPYGQPDSISKDVNGVPVEVVHAILFSRQSWAILMVDLVAACSMHDGSYDKRGYLTWETPEVLHPLISVHETQITVGINGELVEQQLAEERGYMVEKHNSTFQISIPYNTEGGYRKSLVSGDLYEIGVFSLYLEQLSVDENHVETRLRCHKTLTTPPLPRPLYSENRTVFEEHVFTVYLGNIPEDIVLAAVRLNKEEFAVPFANESSYSITEVVHPENTCGYILKVPFDDPVVIQEFSREDRAMQHILKISFTLFVLPENEPFYHVMSVMVLLDASPPVFNASCSESGITFKLDHRPFDYLWEICIGSDVLTPQLAARHSYIMSNDSQQLQLDVPLFTHGYKYKNISLKGFSGTFEILVRDAETSNNQSSAVKTCSFTATEYIMCSANGRVTVVADLSSSIQSGGDPARIYLTDKNCRPKESDSTRALFSFPLNTCGSRVKLGKEYVTYENKIFISPNMHPVEDPMGHINSVTIQCTYPVAGLHYFFWTHRFVCNTVGVGRIVHNATEDLQSPTTQPTTVLEPSVSTSGQSRWPVTVRPGYRLTAQYIKIPSFPKGLPKKGATELYMPRLPGTNSFFPQAVSLISQ